MPKTPIVVIGGSGAARVLEGLRSYPLELTALISTADSGGSTGRLRDELDIIPVGDLRKCLLALSNFSPEEKSLWNFRFTQGSLSGHSLGNLILAGLIKHSKNLDLALQQMRDVWQLGVHQIIPISEKPTTLCATYADGTTVCGEHLIDEPEQSHGEIVKIWLKNAPSLAPQATQALLSAKLIIFAPGDFYTNTLIPLLTKNGPDIFRRAQAPIIFVPPLMTSYGETDNFTLSSLVATLEQYLASRKVDIILANTQPIPSPIVKRYQSFREKPLPLDFENLDKDKKIIQAPLLHHGKITKAKGDILRRSLLQHDPQKLARCIMKIINN